MIDFVIPCHPKDFPSLKLCVEGIKKNISVANKIYVICCSNPNIDGVIHIPEENFSKYFKIEQIYEMFEKYNPNLKYRSKWIYQQFLKLFSSKIIDNLTYSYVIVDSDTIFLRDVSFDLNKFYYSKAKEYHKPYVPPIKKLLGVENTIGFSTISHHMIFNREILNNMVSLIEDNFGGKSFVEVVLDILDYNEASCISEWDLYANYTILNYPEICYQRQLVWEDISFIPSKSYLDEFRRDFDFVSCHAYRRGIE